MSFSKSREYIQHDHGVDTQMGVSFTTWTKIPPQIANNNKWSPLDLYNSGGAYDGFLQFHFGQTSIRGLEELRPALTKTIKPEVFYNKETRFDFLLEKKEQKTFVEVKNVTLFREKETAEFPDAPTARGI